LGAQVSIFGWNALAVTVPNTDDQKSITQICTCHRFPLFVDHIELQHR
jgi:hypothetical protein